MKFLLSFFRPLIHAINEAATVGLLGAINDAFDASQEWFRVSPYGDFPVVVTIDGVKKRVTQRVDRASAEKMVSAFNSLSARAARFFRGLPIYIGHPDYPDWLAKHPGTPTAAQGRIKELQVRDDGLWGRHVMSKAGAELISGEGAAFDSHSPHFGLLPQAGTIWPAVQLNSIGLTNSPNIPGTAIGLNEAGEVDSFPTMNKYLIQLLAALGITVAADADDTKVTSAVNEALPKIQAAIAAQGELAMTKTQLTAAVNEKTTLQGSLATATADATTARAMAGTLVKQLAAERDGRAEVVLTHAVNEGRITQAQRPEWKGKLVAATDFAATEAELTKLVKAVNTRSRVEGVGARKTEEAASAKTISALNEAVAAKEKAGLTHFDAYQAVRKEKPELFSAVSS